MAGCPRRPSAWHRGPWSPCICLSALDPNYSVVGVEETLESFDLAPALERLDGIPVPNVVWFEQRPGFRTLYTPAGRWRV